MFVKKSILSVGLVRVAVIDFFSVAIRVTLSVKAYFTQGSALKLQGGITRFRFIRGQDVLSCGFRSLPFLFMVKQGNYYLVTMLGASGDVMYLRELGGQCWSRTLRNALFFKTRQAAHLAKARACKRSPGAHGVQVYHIDVFGKAENLLSAGFVESYA
jgi:hypothetical protein